ncbi:Bug family tripartite tricarboxylate transporter substrate binding protein [Variovorax guangxiensis]|uniref:Tripartite tricarboxylate transporter substrate binding protein n=1 Tax=Variovorax guangxiensis TaxID=1775474 RepID=A0A502DZ31_9BURK|nr:tripartite tricarboxylate transporter substrate binding protein [Variovorax guangxiensis]RZI69468.1 MAG: tripartite tricarboxylate transporter substrate binding protein [Variovorax sp.]TPG26649.1 tripartite tricarboxylate transporter substrate binding protein [Variovorax ginsengisoli]TPG30374.1 tripartite tricarboxylate transporter substrate binding protein [Variovorax guangxiensis]
MIHSTVTRRVFMGATGAACLPAWADDKFPSRTIKVIAGFPAGGITDIAARALSERMGSLLNTPVVVDNRPGANSAIGTTAVARAPADGYTLAFAGSNAMVLNPLLYRNLPYKVEDFAFLGCMGSSPMVLVVSPSLGVKTLKEFIDKAKAAPGKLDMAHGGRGVINHLTLKYFEKQTGTAFQDVPYKGSAPAILDLVGGVVHGSFDFGVSTLPHIKSGKLIALAVTSSERMAALPDVPTLIESGVPDFNVRTYMLIEGPAAMPEPVRKVLIDSVRAGVESPGLAEKFAPQGVFIKYGSPAFVEQLVRTETALWQRIVTESNITQSDLS